MINFWYLFAAYTIILVAIGSYTLWMGKMQARLSREVSRIKQTLSRNSSDNSRDIPKH
jgi:CcmD family protein